MCTTCFRGADAVQDAVSLPLRARFLHSPEGGAAAAQGEEGSQTARQHPGDRHLQLLTLTLPDNIL